MLKALNHSHTLFLHVNMININTQCVNTCQIGPTDSRSVNYISQFNFQAYQNRIINKFHE